MKKSMKNGFTLLECLLALFVAGFVSILCVTFFKTCLQLLVMEPSKQNQMAILQLRMMCALSSDLHVEDEKLYMSYERKEINLEYDRNRIVQRDGYVIWMEHIEKGYFYEADDKIYLYWKMAKEEYKSRLY
ncbi:MAG: prepilin-type N-terminal cleavage/methylation domain-containing protein [Holdemanella sp.]|nr:prepilin-type N-terminal cleavage/methylation domain-containing protein [Holdemanella sp.]